MSTEESTINFTQRDLRLIAIVLTCLKEELSVDFDKFSSASGLKNAASARTAWHGIKKKLDKMSADGSPASESATPAGKGGKRKKQTDTATVNGDTDEAGDFDSSSPAKKAKKTPTKGKKSNANQTEEDGEDESSASPPKKTKKTPAKGKKSNVKVEPKREDHDDAAEGGDADGDVDKDELHPDQLVKKEA